MGGGSSGRIRVLNGERAARPLYLHNGKDCLLSHNIGIIGYGIVGEGVEHALAPAADSVRIYDKYKEHDTLEETVRNSTFLFVCVPTPCDFEAQTIDLSIMDEVMEALAALTDGDQIVIIKSTVVPGTTDTYSQQYEDLSLAMVPEFLREKTHLEDAKNPSRVVVGANCEEVARRIKSLYRRAFPEVPIFLLQTAEAELVKYMSNCFLATKVILANVFSEYAESIGGDYDQLKEALTADPRIIDDHLEVTEERGFGGKCFPKDLNALIGFARSQGLDADLLDTIWRKNMEVRKTLDWKRIPGASSADMEWPER